ncbi:MAG: AsmA-like C-terminal domain-containing protein [Deltaproteobacteria bacterium]|nr:AsmA-like C-terminal domain-containing protein [Deltaproteobacteria bacterium]MBW2567337.1 AsmA-like C-terminal domain-containing protein [Deltaproteobacteria bacterium]
MKTESFTYDNYSWKPLHADISFERDRVSVGVRTADLCGVSMPGSIDFSPGKVQLDLKPKSERQELDSALACLANKKGLVVGKFDFDGNVTAKARHEDVLKSLQGNLRLDTDGGRIYRWGLLAKVFAILNVTEVFSGRLPDLTKEGFAYDSATVQAEFQGDKLVVKEMVIDSPSMELACLGNINLVNKKLDLKILVAPLKSVDSVVKKIPLVNHVLGGTLISIPIKVEGVVGDPTVTPLSPSAVGSGLMGIMKRTLELPFKIIEPLAPAD